MSQVAKLDLRPENYTAKQLPSDVGAEQAVVGMALYDNNAVDRAERLRPEHFHEGAHGRIWAVIADMVAKGMMADPVTVGARLEGDAALQELGGMPYLADLFDHAPPITNMRDYAAVLVDLSLRRDLITYAGELTAQARTVEPDHPATSVLEGAERGLFEIAEQRDESNGVVEFGDALNRALETAAKAFQRDGALAGLSTGLKDLDGKLGGLHPSDLLVLAGRPSMGKAQGLSERVLLADGSWRRMGDLRLGDELASIDGAPSRVAAIYPQGERLLYRVTFSDGRSTRACGEHLWAIRSSKVAGGKAVVSTDRLREMLAKTRYCRRIATPLVSGHFGRDEGLLVDPWLMGAMLGNGCTTSGHLQISTQDAATLYRVQKVVGADAVVAAGSSYDYRISRRADVPLAAALATYGLIGKGSPDKFVPPEYMRASRESRLELLRGLLDTDGWVEDFGAVRFCSTSRRLADDVQALVRSVGGVCTIATKAPVFTHKGERRDGLPAYVLNISHPERSTLISLKRKQRRCEKPMRFRAPTIVSIEPAGTEAAQCIRVTHPSSLYVTDDYIVTHNTALATNIAFNVARRYRPGPVVDGVKTAAAGGVVAFFSLEMAAEQLAMRIACDVTSISGDKVRKGQIDASEFGRLRDAIEEIRDCPLIIDQTGGISLARLAARARRIKRKRGLDLIVIDYLQLMGSDNRSRGGNRVEEITAITGGLKALAKDLNVPVIALSQLSRQVENREDKRPQLADLRESGSIEQDADVVAFVFREAYYLGRTEPRAGTTEHMNWSEEMSKVQGLAEVIIGKQRHGPIGTVRLAFSDDYTRFSNLADESRYDFSQGQTRIPYGDQ